MKRHLIAVLVVGSALGLAACQTTNADNSLVTSGGNIKLPATNQDGSCAPGVEDYKNWVTGTAKNDEKFCFALEHLPGDSRSKNILFYYHGSNNDFRATGSDFDRFVEKNYSSSNPHHAYAIMSGGHWTTDGRKSTGGEHDCGFNRPGTCLPRVMVEAMGNAQGRILNHNHPDYQHLINVGFSLGGATVLKLIAMQDENGYKIHRTINIAGPYSGERWEETQRIYDRLEIIKSVSAFADESLDQIAKSDGEIIQFVGEKDRNIVPKTVLELDEEMAKRGKNVDTYIVGNVGHQSGKIMKQPQFYSRLMAPFQNGESQFAYRNEKKYTSEIPQNGAIQANVEQ